MYEEVVIHILDERERCKSCHTISVNFLSAIKYSTFAWWHLGLSIGQVITNWRNIKWSV